MIIHFREKSPILQYVLFYLQNVFLNSFPWIKGMKFDTSLYHDRELRFLINEQLFVTLLGGTLKIVINNISPITIIVINLYAKL